MGIPVHDLSCCECRDVSGYEADNGASDFHRSTGSDRSDVLATAFTLPPDSARVHVIVEKLVPGRYSRVFFRLGSIFAALAGFVPQTLDIVTLFNQPIAEILGRLR